MGIGMVIGMEVEELNHFSAFVRTTMVTIMRILYENG
jgi:hypothetical protein